MELTDILSYEALSNFGGHECSEDSSSESNEDDYDDNSSSDVDDDEGEASADELRPTRNFSFLNEAKIMYVLVLIETVELGITRLTNVCY